MGWNRALYWRLSPGEDLGKRGQAKQGARGRGDAQGPTLLRQWKQQESGSAGTPFCVPFRPSFPSPALHLPHHPNACLLNLPPPSPPLPLSLSLPPSPRMLAKTTVFSLRACVLLCLSDGPIPPSVLARTIHIMLSIVPPPSLNSLPQPAPPTRSPSPPWPTPAASKSTLHSFQVYAPFCPPHPFCPTSLPSMFRSPPFFAPPFPLQLPKGTLQSFQLGEGQTLVVPYSLDQLVQELGKPGAHLVAGNTSPGIYKDWPTHPLLVSVNKVREGVGGQGDRAVAGMWCGRGA